MSLTHDQISELGAKWLTSKGYKYVFSNMRSSFANENPDALGFKSGFTDAFVIEVKVSRSDFLADSKKDSRELGKGIGLHYAYLTPKGLLKPEEIPYGWWLLEVSEGKNPKIKIIKGISKSKGKTIYPNTDYKEMLYFRNYFSENKEKELYRNQTVMGWICRFFDRLHESDINLSDLGNGNFVLNRTKYKDEKISLLEQRIKQLEQQNFFFNQQKRTQENNQKFLNNLI